MLVREIMTAPAIGIHQEESLDDAIALLAQRHITALPVIDDHNRVVGVISEIDILRRAVEPDSRAHAVPVAHSEPLPRTLGEIMTGTPTTTTEGADVADLIDLFTQTSFKSLPVVRGDNELVGVVSRSDVIRALWRSDDEVRDELISAVHDYGQDHWQIDVFHGVVEIRGASSAMEREIASAIARSTLGVRRVHVVSEETTA